jgi:hypothetical protein
MLGGQGTRGAGHAGVQDSQRATFADVQERAWDAGAGCRGGVAP